MYWDLFLQKLLVFGEAACAKRAAWRGQLVKALLEIQETGFGCVLVWGFVCLLVQQAYAPEPSAC